MSYLDYEEGEEFGAVASGPTLEQRLVAITKERDELAAKYALLLQEKGAQTTLGEACPGPKHGGNEPILGPKDGSDDSTLGSKHASRTWRTRRQRLLDTIDGFSAHVLEMITGLDREALDVAHECEATRQDLDAASAELKDAESRFAAELENVNALVEEHTRLREERDTFEEQERSLVAQLDGPQLSGTQSVVVGKRQRLAVRLQQAQSNLKETEIWMATTEGDYQKECQQVEVAAMEIEKLKRIVQGKERELDEWLSPESEWFTKELENFRALQEPISTFLDAMRDGLEDGWEGTLGDNPGFLGGLGDYTVHPEMLAHPTNWAPVIESYYLTQVSFRLSTVMVRFQSAILQRVKIQEETAQREWAKGLEAIFGEHAPSFEKCSLPQLTPLAEGPGRDAPEPGPASPSEEPGAGVSLPDPPPPPHLLQGHTCHVLSVVFSGDGSKVISGAMDGTIRVWDAWTGKVQSVLTGHSAGCTSVAISDDGRWIVSGSEDTTARLWNARTGTLEAYWVFGPGQGAIVKAVAFSQDGSRICSGSKDMSVRVWNASQGAVPRVLQGHTDVLTSVAFSRDGTRIASGALDRMIRVWDATTGSLYMVLQGHSKGVSSVAFSGDGTQIVSGSFDQTVRVWDLSTGSTLKSLEGHTDIVTSIAISPDGKQVVSGSYDRTVRVWDALTGEVQSVLEGHSGVVWSVAFSPDGERIASGAHDCTIQIWGVSAPASSPDHN